MRMTDREQFAGSFLASLAASQPRPERARIGTGLCLLIAACILLGLSMQVGAAPHTRYIVKDLGTLGGDNSYAIAVADSGDVVGYSDTGHIDSNGILTQHGFRWRHGTMYDLATPNGNFTYAYGMSKAEAIDTAGRDLSAVADARGRLTAQPALGTVQRTRFHGAWTKRQRHDGPSIAVCHNQTSRTLMGSSRHGLV
jgi:probable HAF family extracellular repeat protein